MKRLIVRLLGIIGLVPARRHALLERQLKEAETRAKKAESETKKVRQLLEEVRAESRAWKTRADDTGKQLKALATEAQRQRERAEKYKDAIDRSSQSAKAGSVDVETLLKRLDEAERELAVAREHLMAVEVKLDILEGAANVLDTRTRLVVAQQAGETGVRR